MSVVCTYVVCSMYVVFCKIDHCIHIHWCIVMGLGHNDPWIESHMWPQQTWGQRSSRGQWPLVQVFEKKGQCIHILWCIFKSNITMIAKVCDRESRRDSWFENHLVKIMLSFFPFENEQLPLQNKWMNGYQSRTGTLIQRLKLLWHFLKISSTITDDISYITP